MQTISPQRAETRSISIDAPPERVIGLVGDGARIPDWAPAFASAVRPDGDQWVITRPDGAQGRIEARVAPEAGTVDLVAPGQVNRGAFMRVLPNGSGSELLFTLFFPDGTAEPAVAAQMATVEDELAAVRSLCEPA